MVANPIRLGIVGLGRAGFGMHTEELKGKADKFVFTAACDIIEERIENMQKIYGCKIYNNIDELLLDKDVEIVDIATRSNDHYEHVLKALGAGKDVIIEKPLALTFDEAKELLEHSNKPGKPRLFMRHNRRFEATFDCVYDVIRKGLLGEVFEINIDQLGYQRRNDWQTLSEFGGGQLLNWGPHIIDQGLMMLGSEIKEITGELKQIAAGGDCEDHVVISLKGENGRTANLCISGGTALNNGRTYMVYGDRGAIKCVNNHIELKYIDPNQILPPVESSSLTPGQSFGATGTFKSEVEPVWIEKSWDIMKEDLTVIWDYIYESYRENKPYPITDEQALRVMKVIDGIKVVCYGKE